MKRFPFIAALLTVCLLVAPGCGFLGIGSSSTPIVNDTPQRQLVREAADINLLCETSFAGLHVAYAAGKISPKSMMAAKSYVDALEVSRKELTAQAKAGNTTSYEATKASILAGLGQIAQAQFGVPIAPLPTTQPVTPPAPPADIVPSPGAEQP